MNVRRINVAREFSRYPAGRYRDDGPFSGEIFRGDFLVRPVKAGDKVVIELDGVRGYGSSFLEEAFGGLVRLGYAPDVIKKTFTLESKDPSLVQEILDYIDHGNDPSDE